MTRLVGFLALFLLPIAVESAAQGFFHDVDTLEPLLGIHAATHGLTFDVLSNGCTSQKDFRVDVVGSDTVRLLLIRERQDTCRAFVSKVAIQFSYESLGLESGQPFIVVNTFLTTAMEAAARIE